MCPNSDYMVNDPEIWHHCRKQVLVVGYRLSNLAILACLELHVVYNRWTTCFFCLVPDPNYLDKVMNDGGCVSWFQSKLHTNIHDVYMRSCMCKFKNIPRYAGMKRAIARHREEIRARSAGEPGATTASTSSRSGPASLAKCWGGAPIPRPYLQSFGYQAIGFISYL